MLTYNIMLELILPAESTDVVIYKAMENYQIVLMKILQQAPMDTVIVTCHLEEYANS